MCMKDSGHLETYYTASMLYPWVTQPHEQLQLLVSTLARQDIERIWNAYGSKGPVDSILFSGNALTASSQFLFDIHTDFLGYSSFLSAFGAKAVRRQCWTPFFAFDFPSSLKDLPDTIREDIDMSAQQSRKLYTEILKTGLAYEAQYATLAGFRGRFYVDTDVENIVQFLYSVKKHGRAFNSGTNCLTKMQSKLEEVLPLIKNILGSVNGHNSDSTEEGKTESGA